MQELKVSDLKPHQQNDYFFDDIQGDNWKDFLRSIEERGVIEPIVVTQDLVIVSGHQRVRACKELGKKVIMTDMRNYQDDDDILRDLIDTNLKQRGIGNPNPIKLGRCIIELERIYGIRNGSCGKRSLDQNYFGLKTQNDLANKLELTDQQLRNYKKLAESSPEIQDMLETGTIKPTVALKIITSMTEEEQEKFIKQNEVAKKITQKQVEEYLKRANDEFNKEKHKLQQDLQREKNNIKTDYKTLERNKQLEQIKSDLENKNNNLKNTLKMKEQLLENYKVDSEEYRKLKLQMSKLQVERDDISHKTVSVLKLTELSSDIELFLYNKLAPTKYKDFMGVLSYDDTVRENFIHTIELVGDWYREMNTYVNQNNYENVITVEVN